MKNEEIVILGAGQPRADESVSGAASQGLFAAGQSFSPRRGRTGGGGAEVQHLFRSGGADEEIVEPFGSLGHAGEHLQGPGRGGQGERRGPCHRAELIRVSQTDPSAARARGLLISRGPAACAAGARCLPA